MNKREVARELKRVKDHPVYADLRGQIDTLRSERDLLRGVNDMHVINTKTLRNQLYDAAQALAMASDVTRENYPAQSRFYCKVSMNCENGSDIAAQDNGVRVDKPMGAGPVDAVAVRAMASKKKPTPLARLKF